MMCRLYTMCAAALQGIGADFKSKCYSIRLKSYLIIYIFLSFRTVCPYRTLSLNQTLTHAPNRSIISR